MKRTGIAKRGKALWLGLVLLAWAAPSFAGVHRFVDQRGVIHITTQAPAAPKETKAPPSLALPQSPQHPAVPPVSPMPPLPPAMPGQQAAAAKPGAAQTISHNQGAGGVIRITNADPAPKPLENPPLTASAPPAAKSPAGHPGDAAKLHAGEAPPLRPGALARVSGEIVNAFIKAATASTGLENAAAPQSPPWSRRLSAAKPGTPVAIPQGNGYGSIRRFKNSLGVLCITNLPSGAPGGGSAPLQLAAASPVLWQGPPAVMPRPPAPAPVMVTAVPRPKPAGSIMVRKARGGKIVISNLQPKGPPAAHLVRNAAARAELLPFILEAAQLYGLPVPLVEAVIKVESNFIPWAVSPKGAMGLMQLMPQTAVFLGVADPFSPRENILGGCRYVRLLLDYFNQSLPLALAAYNAGHRRVVAAGYQVPQIKETQAFVESVLGYYLAAAGPPFEPRL